MGPEARTVSVVVPAAGSNATWRRASEPSRSRPDPQAVSGRSLTHFMTAPLADYPD